MKATLLYLDLRSNHLRRGGWLVTVSLLSLLALQATLSAAAKKNNFSKQATSSRAIQLKVAQSIPYHRINPADRNKIAVVVNRPSVYRRLPTMVVDCDPKLFQSLVMNPEILVNIWEVMGISKMKMTRLKPGFYKASDGAGTTCNLQYIYNSGSRQIIYAQGFYNGALAPKTIKGTCVIVLQSGAVLETNGRTYVTTRMDCFMKLDQFGIELIAKVLKSFIFKSADYNFTESVRFMSRLSRSAEVNPVGMKQLSAKLKNVDAEVKTKYEKTVELVYQNAVKRVELARRAMLEKKANLKKYPVNKVNSTGRPSPPLPATRVTPVTARQQSPRKKYPSSHRPTYRR